ncbi:MAG: Outer membrane protein assembly factor BamD [Phycisphaerae bacterium]|nr:Outer membrane protein assembly factor BamD [Phycisphaerae bacterium]
MTGPALILLTTLTLMGGLDNDPPGGRSEQLEFDPQQQKWIEIIPPVPGTPEGDLALARQLLRDEEFDDAEDAFADWPTRHGEDHPLATAAELGRAQAYLGENQHYKAHLLAKELAVEFSTDEIARQAAEVEFLVAEYFLAGTNRKWLGMPVLPAEDLGISILDDLVAKFPDTEIGLRAFKTKADYFFNRGDFDLAEDEYNQILLQYPRSQYVRYAALRRARAALASFAGVKFDDAPLIEAEERFLRFQQDYPQDAQRERVDLVLEEIRNKRAEKEYDIGRYYLRVDQPRAAAFYFRSVMNNWPGTVAASEAEAELIKMGLLSPPIPEVNAEQ